MDTPSRNFYTFGTVRPNWTPEKQLSGDEQELSDETLKLSGAQEGILHN